MNISTSHVLIVDDDPIVQELCETTLRQDGFLVQIALLDSATLQTMEPSSFDLILIDIHLPEAGGLSLLEHIRERDLDVPILMMSGTATIEHVAKAMRLGAQGLLFKPFSATELRDTAFDILRKRRAVRTHERTNALRPVLQISQRLLTELDLPRLYDLIIDTVRSELDADRASLMLLEKNKKTLRIAALSGLPSGVREGQHIKVQGSLAGWVATHHQPLAVDRDGAVSPPDPDLRGVLFEDNIVSALSVPVLAGRRVLGVLNAAKVHIGLPFTEADKELLMLLAGQAAIALENARLYAKISYSEERYRALLHHATDAVLLLDADGRTILDANLALERLSGYQHDELTQLVPHQLLPQIDDWHELSTNGEGSANGVSEANEIETVLQTNSNQLTPIAMSVSSVPYAGQRLLLVIARDVSERQRIARQLFQTEKLAALGRLSASMAHEINNPLQAIYSSVQLLLNRPLDEEKRRRYLTMTYEEIERLISIVQRILDFYRPSREGQRLTNIQELLESVLQLTEKQVHDAHIELRCELAKDLPPAPAISNHIKQVFFNIIFNAIEAMPQGGDLSIRTFVADTTEDGNDDSFTTISGVGMVQPVQGKSVVVDFSDTGTGIPSQDLAKIFEPFYTTRAKGTGLGLAVSYSIIEQHHGELSVRSVVNEGTTFRVRLPLTSE